MFSNIKLTPFTTFLLLFVVFILVIFLQKWFPWAMPTQKEGYISFYGKTPLYRSSIIIPQYSATSKLLKMFDNLFFDPANGNVVVIDTTSQNSSPYSADSQDMSVNLINHINIYSRSNGVLKEYSIPANSTDLIAKPEDAPNTIQNTYTPWILQNPFKENTMIPWTLFYLPCGGDKTVIHILDGAGNLATYIAVNGNIYKYPIAAGSSIVGQSIYDSFYNIGNTVSSIQNQPSFTLDPKDNSSYIVPSYDANTAVYQLAKGFYYDSTRACLFSTHSSGELGDMHSLVNSEFPSIGLPNKPDTFTGYGTPEIPYFSHIGDESNTMIIFAVGIPNTSFTSIVVINKVNNTYTIQNNVDFKDGNIKDVIHSNIPTGSCKTASPPPSSNTDSTSVNKNTDSTNVNANNVTPASLPWNARNGTWNDNTTIDLSMNSLSSVISQWYLFHPNNVSSNVYSKDYLLKTQIVPPVCPACPSCPSVASSVCTNCGGHGGAGTSGVDKDHDGIVRKIVDSTTRDLSNVVTNVSNFGETVLDDTGKLVSGGANLVTKGVQGGANLLTQGVQGGFDLAEKGVRGGANLVTKGVQGGVDLAEQGIQGGANLVTKGVQGGVGLVEKGVGGTVNLAQQGIGGAVNLVEKGVGGAVNLVEKGASGVGNWITGLSHAAGAPGSSSSDNVKMTGQNQRNNYYNSPYTGGPYNTVPPPQSPNTNIPSLNNAATMTKTDPYSYYGAVPSKGTSQFMPITADFSKFGR
jgi:hypothetical protein